MNLPNLMWTGLKRTPQTGKRDFEQLGDLKGNCRLGNCPTGTLLLVGLSGALPNLSKLHFLTYYSKRRLFSFLRILCIDRGDNCFFVQKLLEISLHARTVEPITSHRQS